MNNVCCISDLHLGCHSDSEHWHNIILEWGIWLKTQLIDKNIESIIMCGDFFDNRNEIGVKTISVASELMNILSDFEITMITGNHDLFYKHRSDVNSVSIFEGRKNVTIINEITRVENGNTTITYIPWGQDISKCEKSDIIFGHFEINGFKMMPGKLAENKTPPKSLTSKSKLTFSGHFHLRAERQYLNAKIVYVGSPYQINWGESSNVPGYYIIDLDDMGYEFFENDISPRHIKMTSENMKIDEIENNIISVEIDSTLSETEIEVIKTKVYNQNPLEAKFNILRDDYGIDSSVKYSNNVDISEIMMNFVDELKLEKFSMDVKEQLKELYDKYNK